MPAAHLLAGLGRRIASMVPFDELPEEVRERFLFVPLEIDGVDALPAPLVAAVFDARRASLDELKRACASPRLARVPRLIVGVDAGAEAELRRSIPLTDAVAACPKTICPEELAGRLGVLAELGAAWLSIELYEQSMLEGVTGLTVAERRGDELSLVYASPAFGRITGYEPDEVLGRNPRLLQSSSSDGDARGALREGVRERRRAQAVLQNARKDGTRFWNEVTVFPLHAQGAELPLFGGVQHDVTALVESQARVQRLTEEQERRVSFDQALLEALELGVMTLDHDGRVTFANDAARAVMSLEQVEGVELRRALGVRSDPWVRTGEVPRRFSHRMSGREIDVTVRRLPAPTLSGLAGLVILRDVTGERELQDEMRRVERLAAMGTMVAGFAHEVRNPVASLRAMAEQLDEDLAEEGVSLPHAGRMLKVLGRIEALVHSSLRFGRPASARPIERRPWELVSAALAAVSPRTRAMGGDIRIEVEPDLPSVFVDEGQLVQVLVILLDNALDATQSPRRVALRALSRRSEPRAGSEPPPSVCIEVTDDGAGIPQPVIGRIFDPFFTTKPSGTGLGLSIAQQLVAENGGRMEVSSEAGGPTTFTVRLGPCLPPDSTRG